MTNVNKKSIIKIDKKLEKEKKTMKKFLKVLETSEERRTRIEEKLEFINSATMWILIILFAILGLSRFDIIPETSVYAAIYTALAIIAMAVIAFVFEQIKLLECEEEEEE